MSNGLTRAAKTHSTSIPYFSRILGSDVCSQVRKLIKEILHNCKTVNNLSIRWKKTIDSLRGI